MNHTCELSSAECLERLKEGNKKYQDSDEYRGDISRALRLSSSLHGQAPYAVILTCSDSRVIPESIFSAGIGELFVIRVAGNVIDNHQMGSIEYAVHHLGCRLVVVLGHTGCGAVEAALSGDPSGFIAFITDEIKKAIGAEKDAFRAECLNVQRSVDRITQDLDIPHHLDEDVQILGAMVHLDTGVVDFL